MKIQQSNEHSILIVDDDETLRGAIAFDFRRQGYQVLEASNGADAFELVRRNKVDLILTDIRMPGGDGIGLLDQVKGRDPELPIVILMTGFSDVGPEDAYDKGADAIFAKPFDREALFLAIKRALSTKEEKWGGLRKIERTESDFEITLNFPDLDYSLKGKVLNIGRGGIYVALTDRFPSVGAKTRFSVSFDGGEIVGFEGEGLVRWVRQKPVNEYKPGCGVEFSFLADDGRTRLISLINSIKSRAFIPKT